ncbi:sulfatase-like hydrolase/transferase [Haloarcula marismortui]|uniref:sulfatase-like hydrolase/transferase n=1 Tax=Haloarcula marismortui TaxID=2238 RepID=UPI003C727357
MFRLSIRGETVDSFRVTEDSNGFTINSDELFQNVTFHIVGLENVESCKIKILFEDGSQTIDSKDIIYNTGVFDARNWIEVNESSSDPVSKARIFIDSYELSTNPKIEHWLSKKNTNSVPYLSTPSPSRSANPDNPPIIIVSVDSLRHDRLSRFKPLLNEMDGAVTPSEPRTQGTSTWPAHASLFTGVHPLEHGCTNDAIAPQIDPSLTTLAELLEKHGYRNSAVVSSGNLSPQLGYGRGFHRYQVQDIDWKRRERDVRTVFRTFKDWMSADIKSGATRGSYFLHIFDVHYPYIPPDHYAGSTDFDFSQYDTYVELAKNRDYVDLLKHDPLNIDEITINQITGLYDRCVDFVVDQLLDLILYLKRVDVYDDSLIIIAGDHGEDFYERNFIYHHSLYNENIKPGMIVKPPASGGFSVPDEVDYIDILPTIASLLGSEKAVDQSSGSPFTERTPEQPRITERLLDTYNVSIELHGEKLIFTYTGNKEPSKLVEGGPSYIEQSSDDGYRAVESRDELTEAEYELETHVRSFVKDRSFSVDSSDKNISSEVEDRLEELGYK